MDASYRQVNPASNNAVLRLTLMSVASCKQVRSVEKMTGEEVIERAIEEVIFDCDVIWLCVGIGSLLLALTIMTFPEETLGWIRHRRKGGER